MLVAQQRADELQLAQHETWLALLHYKRETLSHSLVSQADDPRFFLAEEGRIDAAAELHADITAFFDKQKPQQAQCLFPARWYWLKQQLDLSDEFDVSCPGLDAFVANFSHHKLFLAFPAMYLNNPGSTFGHTFLRFDGDANAVLLSQTLNYAARIDNSDSLVPYIGKGLFGGYRGFFRVRPYSETVREYSNIDNRDIWEYRLNFSEAEIQQLIRHVWEVKGIDFDYYFLRENCAYRLLALLDVIRPGMDLTAEDDFPVYAIPVDTVRALDTAGLIEARQFRASLVTELDNYFADPSVSDKETEIVLAIIAEDIPAESNSILDKLSAVTNAAEKRKILEQSYNILLFRGDAESAKARLILDLKDQLPDIDVSVTDITIEAQTDILSPEKGHESIRVAVGYGQQNTLQYIDLRFRPAFHDLLDAPRGFVNGAAINVLDTRLKWFVNNGNDSDSSEQGLRLETLSLFNVTSLNPVRQWQSPVSWMLDFRFDRSQLSDVQSAKNFISHGGIGFSFKQQAMMSFVLLKAEWNLSSDYQKGYSLLLGLQAGLRFSYRNNQLLLSYQADEAVSGFDLGRKISEAQWQYNLQANHALRAVYKRTEYDFYNDEDWTLNYHYYF